VDNYDSVGNSLGSGVGKQLYHGRIYPYPSGGSCYHRDYPNHPGPENFVVKTAQTREQTMLMNIFKAGEHIMVFNELANQVKKIRYSRTKDIRRNRTRNMIIGAGIGSALGIVAGILFAPKPGSETRQAIADRTGKTVKNLKDNVAVTKARIFASSTEKKSRSHKAGEDSDETGKETLKK
jgi:gas vesicle protein